jgi:aryl carrier-like protein
MSIEDWTAATKPKVDGSWNLHTLLPKGMDFFILLSSHSGLIGAHGQSNYAAGNVFQDVLAHHRTRLGEKAISIDLGTMSSIGYVANNSDVMAQALKQVMEDFSEQELLSLLEIYCDPERPAPPASDAVIVTPMPIPALLRAQGITEPFWMSKPIFRHLHQISTVGQAMPSETKPMRNWEAILREAKTMVDAENTVQEAIRNQLADLLAIGVDDVDASKPVHSYGVDSLVAVELRNWFARSIGADVAVLELLGNSTIAKLAANVAKKCRFVSV